MLLCCSICFTNTKPLLELLYEMFHQTVFLDERFCEKLFLLDQTCCTTHEIFGMKHVLLYEIRLHERILLCETCCMTIVA